MAKGTSRQEVLAEIRRLILDNALPAGERISEHEIARRLNVSRTPVRLAFSALAQEGLLVKAETRGYRVRRIEAKDIADAIEVRGALEGVAARLAAQNGLSSEQRQRMEARLADGDALFAKGRLEEADVAAYHDLNMDFHAAIIEASGNHAIFEALARNDHLPFASIASLAVDLSALEKEFRRLNFAHMQHHVIFDAIRSGEGARAEAAMREHAYSAMRYIDMFGRTNADGGTITVVRRH